MNEIQIQKIRIVPGEIDFSQYEELQKEALEVYRRLETVKVNEDSVKASKKLVAAVNKSIKKLESERVNIKNQILVPYLGFESKVKDIVKIVKDADKLVRDQIKELEDVERDRKEETIKELFESRLEIYDFKEIFTFNDFLKPQHLNKSVYTITPSTITTDILTVF